MKLVIAGSRTLDPTPTFILNAIQMMNVPVSDITEIEVVSGGAKGVDQAGENFAEDYFIVPLKVTKFPADWYAYGKAAGPKRNKQMAEYADALLLIWDGDSRGSRNMKETMIALGKPVYEVILRTHNSEKL